MRRAVVPAAISAVVLSALVLSGCSTATPSQDDTATEIVIAAPLQETGDSPYKALADAFMKKYPQYTVKIDETSNDTYGQNLTTKLQAGNADDLFELAPGRGQDRSVLTLAEAGYLVPLDDTNAAATVPAGSEDQFNLDGKLYAQGLDFAVAAIVANLNLMKADGIVSYPTTYKELLADCAVAKDHGHSFFVIAGSMTPNTGFFSMVMAGDLVYGPNPTWNTDRFDKKVTFADDKGWNATLNRFLELKDAGCFQESPEAGTFDTITNNLVGEVSYAGAIPSGAAFGLGGANPNAAFVVEPFPAASAKDSIVSASVNYSLGINAKSKAISLAKKFLDFASSAEGASIFPGVSGNLPVVGADFSALPPQYAGVAQLLQDGKTYALPNSNWEAAEVYNNLGTGVQGLFTGQTTVKDVLKSMDSAW
jgi:raffinose/stachyose/melibiose transport system substrate-binding protein